MKHLTKLRNTFKKLSINGFIIPVNDEFNNEFVPSNKRRLEWLTGFSGSSGIVIILEKTTAFFTDGRYILQASKQINIDDCEIHNTADITLSKWIEKNVDKENIIGFDPMLHTYNIFKKIEESANKNNIILKPVKNPIDNLWQNKPKETTKKAFIYNINYAGQSSESKIENIRKYIENNGADTVLLTASDSICWLLNIRGCDVPNSPLLLCYCLVYKSGDVEVFVDMKKITDDLKIKFDNRVSFYEIEYIEKHLKQLGNKKIILDGATAQISFVHTLKSVSAKIIYKTDPCILPKACKNDVELKGMREAHIADGTALCKFLFWLENSIKNGVEITECDIDKKLIEFRKIHKTFKYPSFDTIAGYSANGAIIHYRAKENECMTIKPKGLLLIDSGGQYLRGTTDVSRTIAMGELSEEEKRNYTLVLKGHINLASTKFPEKTTGHSLDVLARKYLWKEGLDYDHGTGHGVGTFLNVHEGPQNISKKAINSYLQKGMITSNEPGYYKNGKYGIRIESLIEVIESKNNIKEEKKFYEFDTITLVPIDLKPVIVSMLDKKEKKWLNNYHKKIYKYISHYLEDNEKKWLEDYAREI